MYIREATLRDNAELIELQAKCPQGTTIIVSTINKPDFFARVKAYRDYAVFVAVENDRIIASAACALREGVVNGNIETLGHEFQLFVDPDYRGRRIAGQLHQFIEEYLESHRIALSYCLVMEGNTPSIRHGGRQGLELHCTLTMPAIAVFKELSLNQAVRIRAMNTDDIPTVTALVNETWEGYELYEPMSPEEFTNLVSRIPEYDHENIFVLEEDGEIVACLGFWDWSKVMQLTVEALSRKMKALSILFNTIGMFRPIPKPPKAGDLLKQIVITMIGYKELRYVHELLKYLNNKAYLTGIQQIFFICNKGNPLLKSLKGFIHIDTSMNLYVKPLRKGLQLNNRPVCISGFDL